MGITRCGGGWIVAIIVHDSALVAINFGGADGGECGRRVEQDNHFAAGKTKDGHAIVVGGDVADNGVDLGADADGHAEERVEPIGWV